MKASGRLGAGIRGRGDTHGRPGWKAAASGRFRGMRNLFGLSLFGGLLALVLVVAFVGAGSGTAKGEEPQPSSGAAEGAHGKSGGAVPQEAGGVELKSARTATSDTYALPDGEREARIYEAPVNYRNSDGEWEPIKEGFKENGSEIEDGSHPFEIHLPSHLGDGPVRFGGKEHWIAFELAGPESGPAEVESSGQVSYELPRSETSFEYSTLPDGVKETIELAGPSSPATIHYRLSAASGITPEIAQDGSIEFREEAGKEVAVMPAPTVSDAASVIPESGHASYVLSHQGEGEWDLAVEVERSWLEAPHRAWPATIDPTVEVEGAGTAACNLASGLSESADYCNGSGGGLLGLYMFAGEEISGSQRAVGRSLINFNLGSIPAGAEIKQATVNLYSPMVSNVPGLELRRVTSAWGASEANWDCRSFESPSKHKGCIAWGTKGGDFNGEGSEILTSAREGGGAAGWWRFSDGLAPVFQGWLNGNLEAGLLLRMKNEGGCSSNCLWFGEWPSGEAGKRPYASIHYLPKAPASSMVSLPTEGTRTAGRLRLKAKWGEEPGSVSGVTFEYRTGKKEKGAFQPIPPRLVHQANGEAVKAWPLTEASFEGFGTKQYYLDAAELNGTIQKEGGAVFIRAVFEGSKGAQGYSEPVETVVDRVTGSPHDAVTGVGPGTLDLETGNLSISHADVSIPTFNSGLEFSRTYNSRAPHPVTEAEKEEPTSVLGPGWKPGIAVEEAGGSEWRNVRIVKESGSFPEEVGCEEEEECEPETISVPWELAYASVTANEGGELSFEETSANVFATPPELPGWQLTKEGSTIKLKDPAGNITTFSNEKTGGGNEYMPESVSQSGGAGTTRYEWAFKNGEKQLTELIAPAAPGTSCVEVTASAPSGCKALKFDYSALEGVTGERLTSIEFLAPGNGGASTVAEYGYTEGRLVKEWDPRISPELVESYTYGANGELKTITPPGQKPWTLEYGTVEEETGVGRLVAVKRASLLASPSTATTTIAYDVPVSGSKAPYEMGGTEVAKWGQKDLPVEATAIFPPSEEPTTNPPSSWAQATVYYMDSEGYAVNTATPKGGGTSEPSISTAEPDEYGNIVRELTPDNRLAVLREPAEKREEKWKALETKRRYTQEGTQMVEEWGPMHQVRIAETGTGAEARLHRVVEYIDREGLTPKPHLPTRETVGASNPEWSADKDQKVTETEYDWTLRKPIATIVDPGTGHLDIKSVTAYNDETGLPVESRQPKEQTSEGAGGKGAGTTKTIYFEPGFLGVENIAGCKSTKYSGLPCKVEPAAQLENPKLLVKRFASYNALGEPEKVIESPGGSEEKEKTRTTVTTYDAAGRQLTAKTTGGGTEVPKTETVYNSTLGFPEKQQFVCEAAECAGSEPVYQKSFAGSETHQLSGPRGIAADGAGHVWVVDRGHDRVEEFDESGKFLMSFGEAGSGNGQFSEPWGITVTEAGNLWVADTGNHRVEEFNSEGKYIQQFGTKASGESKGTEFVEPEGIVAAPGGMIWVSDGSGHRVGEFREKVSGESERFVRNVGTTLPTDPISLALDASGDLWVADEGAGHVLEYSAEGAYIRTIGEPGSEKGQLSAPTGVGIAPSGDIYVVQRGKSRVSIFHPNGTFVTTFGSSGTAEGPYFSEPRAIAFSGETAFVTDKGNNRVDRWQAAIPFRTQTTTTTYNELGQVTKYEDADGNTTKTSYDIDGRPVTVSDAKGTQTYHYNETSGLLTSLEDSAAGTFTATYDADGNLVERGLPNGLTAKTTYNSLDEPMSLAYTKGTSTWYEESLERSIEGQIVTNNGTIVSDHYKYDKAGRLTEAQETPSEAGCTSRIYTYDADSNRLAKTTREPGVGGSCATEGGATQKYEYDAADRLVGPTYDSWGRITKLPAEFAGGKTLETTYYSSNMVATQTQNGVTNSYELDATGRQRERTQAGGVAGTEIFHYDGPGDSPSWTSLGSTWSRDIVGIGGELAAIQESSGTLTFKLTDLHGDVVASAGSSPTETKLLATYRFDEFGEPEGTSSAGRLGWLGGHLRRTELSSGVIQMGARSYIPSLGRFLTPDPVAGGSANPYDYANQDPVNTFDLEGSCTTKKKCAAAIKAAKKKVRAEIEHTVQVESRAINAVKNAAHKVTRFIWVPPVLSEIGHLVQSGVNDAENVLSGIVGQPCKHAAGIAGLGAFGVWRTGESAQSVPDGGPAASALLKGISGALVGLGGALTAAHEAGVC